MSVVRNGLIATEYSYWDFPAARPALRGSPSPRRIASAMKAVILAGGVGSRISEETVSRPKPMVEIGSRRCCGTS